MNEDEANSGSCGRAVSPRIQLLRPFLAVTLGGLSAVLLAGGLWLTGLFPDSGHALFRLQMTPQVSTLALNGPEPSGIEETAQDKSDQALIAQETTESEPQTGSGDNRRFAEAFGDLAPPAPVAAKRNASGFLEVDYDIGTLEPVAENYDRSDGSLTVKKPLFVDGKSSGSATIRIEEGAQILIATSSVAKALGDKASRLPRRISGALQTGTGFIPFYELRGAGIEVAYDPVKDRVSLSMPT